MQRFIRISRTGDSPFSQVVPFSIGGILGVVVEELREMEEDGLDGDSVVLTVVSMTQEEFEALPEVKTYFSQRALV